MEVRLNVTPVEPDLHQLIFLQGDDLQVFGEYLETAAIPTPYPAGLRSLAQLWHNPEQSADRPAHLYLEWDFDSLDGAPAVFLPVQPNPEASPEHRAIRIATLNSLTDGRIAGHGTGDFWPLELRTVSISHLGAMSSRGALLRVNYRGIRLGQLGELLSALAWPGEQGHACSVFDRLVEIADKVTMALNFSNGQALPGIGFEVLFEEAPAMEPRWKQLFAVLREMGTCTEDEERILLGVTRQIHPYDAGQSWPAAWMVATELKGGIALPRVERALSHVKVSLSAEGAWSAKAYVSAQQRWDDEPAPEPAACHLRAKPSETIEAAISFLLKRQLQSGWWTEFHTLLGPSDEWTTAFVGYTLARCCDPATREAVRRGTRNLLARQRAEGGWGYSAASPPDADSTAWALKLLETVGADAAAREGGTEFLRLHSSPAGGVTTYRSDAAVRFPGEMPLEDASGWQSDHLCVHANAAPLLGTTSLCELAARQDPDGFWPPYWWSTPALSTALACEALAGLPGFGLQVDRAVKWASHYAPQEPSAFVESWLIRIQLCGGETDRHAALARAHRLRGQQHADGSWASSADLRIPAASDRNGTTAPRTQYESRCVFTTAAVLQLLLLCANLEKEHGTA